MQWMMLLPCYQAICLAGTLQRGIIDTSADLIATAGDKSVDKAGLIRRCQILYML